MTDLAGKPHPSIDRSLLLQAALDGELDTPAMLEFERQLAEDSALNAEYRRLSALRQAIHKLPKVRASDAFRARIEAIAAGSEKRPQSRPTNKWLGEWRPTALAASIALVLGSGLTFLMLPAQSPDVLQELVAGHARGMISGQPTDVTTSDRHTVKPWFATRLTQAPQVVDLSDDGFPLVGGRIDVIDGKPVPTLVFRHAKHMISLTELPGGMANFSAAETHRTVKGYSVLTWTEGESAEDKTIFVAVSDIAPAELDALAAAFRKTVALDH